MTEKTGQVPLPAAVTSSSITWLCALSLPDRPPWYLIIGVMTWIVKIAKLKHTTNNPLICPQNIAGGLREMLRDHFKYHHNYIQIYHHNDPLCYYITPTLCNSIFIINSYQSAYWQSQFHCKLYQQIDTHTRSFASKVCFWRSLVHVGGFAELFNSHWFLLNVVLGEQAWLASDHLLNGSRNYKVVDVIICFSGLPSFRWNHL